MGYIPAAYKFYKVSGVKDTTRTFLVLIIIALFVISIVASALLTLLE